MTSWLWIAAAGVGCYLVRAAGLLLPLGWVDRPAVRRVTEALPLGVLAALAVTGTFSTATRLTVDHRAAGLACALVAVLLRAPFVVVIVAAAAGAALAAALG